MTVSDHLRTKNLLILSFVLLLCCGCAAAGLLWKQDQSDRWVHQTVEVQSRLAQARIFTLRAEVSRRGYALTGNADDLIDLAASRSAAQEQLVTLDLMTSDNPLQRENVGGLRRAVATRFASMDQTLALVRQHRFALAARIIDSESNRRASMAIVMLLERIAGEEARLLVDRKERAHRQERLARTVMTGSFLLILLFAGLVWRDRLLQFRELRKANDELAADILRREAAEAQLTLLATNATDAVFRLTLDGTVLYASQSTRHVLDADPKRLIGQTISFGVHPDDKPVLADGLKLLRDGSRNRLSVTYRTSRAEPLGAWRWVEANVGVVGDAGREPIELIASLRDVSERKQLELELDSSRLRAEAAVHAKSNFLANMSHEIRTPMNGVIGFTELLLMGQLAPEQRRQVELIADSGGAMMRLLNDILDLSKVEAGQMRIASEPVDLRHALRACARLVAPAVEKKGLVLDVDIADALPVAIRSDGLRLRQIILNLLGNAAKFTLEGSITLRARAMDTPDGRRLVIEVEDTGVGIPPDRREAVFETFVQADADTASRFGGTGLGLPISSKLAELMGGHLTLSDAVGDGSRFVLELPLVPDELGGFADPRPFDAPVAEQPVRRHRSDTCPRILVAEDHDVNQLLITAMLRQLGYDHHLASDGSEAVAMAMAARARGEPYHLVLLDVQMPVMDGPTAARQLRDNGVSAEELPIVALTANAYADDVAACLAAGMQAHLAKPASLASLADALRRWGGLELAANEVPVANPGGLSAKVRERYALRKQEALQATAHLLRRGSYTDAELKEVGTLLHKLAGTAAMFGEAALGDRARELEDRLVRWRDRKQDDAIKIGIEALRDAA